MFDVLIIGAGPGGITAGIYAARANLKVGIIENNAPGGQMVYTYSIENYPGYKKIDGATLALNMFEQMIELGVEYIGSKALEINKVIEEDKNFFIVTTDDKKYEAKTVIIATGTKNKKLDIEGEEKFNGYGISWCAICDGALYRGLDVAVIGGGNSALEEALYLSTLVNKVYIIHRRDEFRADEMIVSKVRNTKNIELITSVNVVKFSGDKTLEEIVLEKKASKEQFKIKVSGCFEYIGTSPASELVNTLGIVNENGYISVDENFETNIKGLFACGDIVDKKIRQIATAINDGAIASLYASKYCK